MKRSGLEVQKAAIFALFLRELKTRFGKYRLGYLWAPLEPTAHMLIMLFIFGFIMKRAMPDISFPVFLVNGIIPWFIFNSIATRSLNAVSANQALFHYRPVKPIDTVISRGLLEVLIYSVVYILLMLAIRLMGEEFVWDNIPLLIGANFALIAFSLGLGLIFMVLGDISEEASKFLPLILKPLYFLSGIMFSIHSVPKEYQNYLLWNPILHAVELSRQAVFPAYQTQNISFSYLCFCALGMLFIGLVLYRYREEAMLTSS